MPDYTRRIEEIREVHKHAVEAWESALRQLGSAVRDLPRDAIPADASAFIERHDELTEEVRQAGEEIQRLLDIDSRQQELRRSMGVLQDERDRLRHGLEPVFEHIGRVGFDLFRERPVSDPAFAAVFEKLAKHHDAIRAVDRDTETLAAETQHASGVRSILKKTRLASLKRRRGAMEHQSTRHFQDAGRELAEHGFAERTQDAAFSESFEPLRRVWHREAEIDTELSGLTTESGALLDAFNELAAGQKLARARAQREERIAAAREELGDVLARLGHVALDTRPAALNEQLEALDASQRRVEHFARLLERLEAGRDALATSDELERIGGRIDEIKQRIESLQQDRKALQAEERSKRADLDRMLERRGPEHELFAE